jgi:DNA-binding GntR family transcriptional regulator
MEGKPRVNLVNVARETLERYILDGVLPPNHHLVEAELASKLKISRTPLREALRQLEIKGYVSRRDSVGYVVTSYTSKDIREVFDLREALEVMAARFACERATEEQLQKMEEYLANYDRDLVKPNPTNVDTFFHGASDWNNLFHEAIYQAAGNQLLETHINNLRDIGRLKHVVQFFTDKDLLEFQRQHHLLLDALKARDKERAEHAVRLHLNTLYNFYTLFV